MKGMGGKVYKEKMERDTRIKNTEKSTGKPTTVDDS